MKTARTNQQPEDAGGDRAYQSHADAQDTTCAAALEAYIEGLSEEERLEYERCGLIEKPGQKPAKAKKWTRVGADEERSILREAESPREERPDEMLWAKEAKNPILAALEVVRFILAAIIDAKQPRLEASLLAVAVGIGALMGLNYYSLALRYDSSAAEIERAVNERRLLLDVKNVDLTLPRFVISHVLDDKRPRLQADTFALALGFPLRQGMSERKLAIEYGLTVAALSARVIWWVGHMDARLPGVCKRNTANYAARNVRRLPDDPFAA